MLVVYIFLPHFRPIDTYCFQFTYASTSRSSFPLSQTFITLLLSIYLIFNVFCLFHLFTWLPWDSEPLVALPKYFAMHFHLIQFPLRPSMSVKCPHLKNYTCHQVIIKLLLKMFVCWGPFQTKPVIWIKHIHVESSCVNKALVFNMNSCAYVFLIAS